MTAAPGVHPPLSAYERHPIPALSERFVKAWRESLQTVYIKRLNELS
jgi:hypothetical protein